MKKFKRLISSCSCVIFLLALTNPIMAKAKANDKPGTPTISHDNWSNLNDYQITMNLWWGENGESCKLYENGVLIDEVSLTDNSPSAQKATFDIKAKNKGTYTYKCELINKFGKSTSNEITVTVNQDYSDEIKAPQTPNGLKANVKSKDSIEIVWNLVTGADSYDLDVDGKIIENVKSPFMHQNLAANTKHTYKVRAKNTAGYSAWSNVINATTESEEGEVIPPNPDPNPNPKPDNLPDKLLVGYWHNFDNGSTSTPLKDTSLNYDIIDVAFAESESDQATMYFEPYNNTVEGFRKEVEYLQSKGKKVIISIGGQNGRLDLDTKEKEDIFVNTMIDIVKTYNFDGIDIDLEGGAVALGPGDTDINNPTTPKVKNLISGVKRICATFGDDFILTMAPEVTYVQGGLIAYAGPWGAYLPVIHNLRDELTLLHVQHYNHGSQEGLDGNTYMQGTADFQVAMAEMMITGFNIGRDPNNFFPGLPAYKIAIGLPSCTSAAGGGYTPEAEVVKALDYLIEGKDFGGKYKLQNPEGYKDFRGVMTWSTNWDETVNNKFSNTYRTYFDSLK